jgi:CRISPR-associated protein Cas2
MERQHGHIKISMRGARESTLYVIAYDIPDDKRRTKVHSILKGFGQWTEFSLFECFLTRKELLMLRAKLDPYLDVREDRLRIYMICDACLSKIETVGIPEPVEDTSYLI